MLKIFITQKESRNRDTEFTVLNIEKWRDDARYTPLNEPQSSTPNTVLNSEVDLDLPPSNQISLDGNLDFVHAPDFGVSNGFTKLSDLDNASKQTLFKEGSKNG